MSNATIDTVTVEIGNLTQAQAIALEDMLATWMYLGNIGSSRWTSFYADGDGNFRPQIKINGKRPEMTTLLDRDQKWKGDEYRIDFDKIAWKLRGAKDRVDGWQQVLSHPSRGAGEAGR